DRHSGDLAFDELALADMDARPNLDAERAYSLDDLARAEDRPGRPFEGREEAVPRGVALDTSVSAERFPHSRIVRGQELLPSAVAERRLLRRRVDDVGEEDGREDGLDRGRRGVDAAKLADEGDALVDCDAGASGKSTDRRVRHEGGDVIRLVRVVRFADADH